MANFSLEKKATLHFYQQGVTQPSSPLPRQPHNRTFNSASLVNEKRSLKALCCSVPWILEHLTHWQLICTPSVTFCSWYLLTAVKVLVAQSCESLWPHGPWPASLLCPRDSPGKSTGVDSHSLLQRNFLTQESNVFCITGGFFTASVTKEAPVEFSKIILVRKLYMLRILTLCCGCSWFFTVNHSP